MDNTIKRDKLRKFHSIYYGDDSHFKIKTLPYWMDKYASLLKREQERKLPRYYRKFNQGTVVMIDFGVRVGSEMSGGHFGVVLNSKDDKFERNLIVVPLTSKEKSRYVSLDREVLVRCVELLKERSNHCLEEIAKLEKRKNDMLAKFEVDVSSFSATTNNDIKILTESGINTSQELKITLGPDDEDNIFLYNLLDKIKQSEGWEKSNVIKSLVETLSNFLNAASDINTSFSLLEDEVNQLETLGKRMERYTNSTFADVNNITTVSKLRVQKFSDYNISGNISLSDNSVNKIKHKLLSII